MAMTRCMSLLLTLALLCCAPAPFADETEPAAPTVAAIGPDGKQHVAVLGGSSFFRPKHIVVKVNVPVELSVRREPGIVPHTFVLKIPEAGIAIDESIGTAPKVFAFTPTAVGKFAFYCRNRLLFFKSHRDKGMEGVLEVVP